MSRNFFCGKRRFCSNSCVFVCLFFLSCLLRIWEVVMNNKDIKSKPEVPTAQSRKRRGATGGGRKWGGGPGETGNEGAGTLFLTVLRVGAILWVGHVKEGAGMVGRESVLFENLDHHRVLAYFLVKGLRWLCLCEGWGGNVGPLGGTGERGKGQESGGMGEREWGNSVWERTKIIIKIKNTKIKERSKLKNNNG